MTTFAEACGAAGPARMAAAARMLGRMRDEGIERVRIGWCDLHGALRGKTLMPESVPRAIDAGVGMVSTILLKDSSDRTAYRVFEPGVTTALPGFGFANNVVLLPDPASFQSLPWAPGTGWLRAEAWFEDATPVPIDTRQVLRAALDRLAAAGFGLKCGLEVEFHIHRLVDGDADASLDPDRAGWPGQTPAVRMIHPGYNLLAESATDMADDALRIVQHTAQGLGLPLASLEIELGPSQVEAVFDATDALTAADQMVAFRNGVRQALRREGFHASFVCVPPFAEAMASGWHLHQSLVDLRSGENAFRRTVPGVDCGPLDAASTLSDAGAGWLAGLLAHGRAMAVFCAPTINAYARFRPNAMAPNAVIWGRDHRGAMLRVLGRCGDPATRIENRIGEPAANPYLYLAAQIHAGLDGIERGLRPPPATGAPYADEHERLPASLGEALDALAADAPLCKAFGSTVVDWLSRVKRFEIARHDAADDKRSWEAREYFGRL
ncbi:MAG TPA: glutamine synthetase family protein [Caldimonas sp.]|nr:glutamine synthetase family protein [Caldimonas sp.]